MWWSRRRRRSPIWVWLLALLGLKSVWGWRVRQASPEWQEKRDLFRQKMDEAFSVWRDPEAPGDDTEAPTEDAPRT